MIQTVRREDPNYPARLLPLEWMPERLFLRGAWREPAACVAIVGTRRCTDYGRLLAERFARAFAEEGVAVVSGLAWGIDAAAHEGCLAAGGYTIAVLGCGVDRIAFPSQADLQDRIAREGCLLSEYPPGTPPRPIHFPERNRIVSGLADAVVVVEAPQKSGAIITAGWAAQQGKDVFAVPGPVGAETSAGCLNLLKQGAQLAETPEDVLLALGSVRRGKSLPRPSPFAAEEGKKKSDRGLWELLGAVPIGLDAILDRTGLSVAEANRILLELQAEGRIRELPGRRFIRAA